MCSPRQPTVAELNLFLYSCSAAPPPSLPMEYSEFSPCEMSLLLVCVCARTVDAANAHHTHLLPVALLMISAISLVHQGTRDQPLASRKLNKLQTEECAGDRADGRPAISVREGVSKIKQRSCSQPPTRLRRLNVKPTKPDNGRRVEQEDVDRAACGGRGRHSGDRMVVRYSRLLLAPCHRGGVPQVRPVQFIFYRGCDECFL